VECMTCDGGAWLAAAAAHALHTAAEWL
jgi:hypothetical protein